MENGATPSGTTRWEPDDSATNFLWDFYVQLDSASVNAAQALEFDAFQFVKGYNYMIGTECNLRGGGVWDTWNEATGHWVHTSIPCSSFSPNSWHHIQWYMTTNTSNHTYTYVTLVVDGKSYPVNVTQSAKNLGWSDNWACNSSSTSTPRRRLPRVGGHRPSHVVEQRRYRQKGRPLRQPFSLSDSVDRVKRASDFPGCPSLFHLYRGLQVDFCLRDLAARGRHPEADLLRWSHHGVIREHVAVQAFHAFRARNVERAAEQFRAHSFVLVVVANDDRGHGRGGSVLLVQTAHRNNLGLPILVLFLGNQRHFAIVVNEADMQ